MLVSSIIRNLYNLIIKKFNMIKKINFVIKELFCWAINIEYLEIREENQLTEVKKLSKKIRARVFIAVKIGKVRLIDNIRIRYLICV